MGSDRVIHDFPKNISSKVNVIARLEFELAYYDVVVNLVIYNVIETLPQKQNNFSIL